MNIDVAHHLELAEAAFQQGQFEVALLQCQAVLSARPAHLEAGLIQAEAHRHLHRHEVAEQQFLRLAMQHPAASRVWSGIGVLCFDQGRIDEAAKHFSKAIRLDHLNADAAYGRGLVRERRGDRTGAMRDFVRAWQLSSWYPVPSHLSDAQARELLLEAATEDPLVGPWLSALPVTLEEVPALDICTQYDPPVSPSELLGHIVVPRPGHGLAAPCIVLFRANIARFLHNRDDVLKALQLSVVRELEEYIRLYATPVDADIHA